MDTNIQINIQNIVSCFQKILYPNTDPVTRKNADQYLIEIEKNPIQLLPKLMQIVDSHPNDQIKFQALLFFSNVIKRTWTSRRLKQVHSAYENLKKNIRTKILLDLYNSPKVLLFTYFDIVKYIAKVDFPHQYPQFSQLIIKLTEQLSIDQNCVTKFKEIKQIFNELAIRKGTTSIKFYQQSLNPILQKMCMASTYFKNQIDSCIQNNNLDSSTAKLSKYVDQIILSIIRMGPYQILDIEETLVIIKNIHKKLDHLLSLHGGCKNNQLRIYLQKNIKSLIYDLSALQQSNPFVISAIISDYFVTLSQIIVNPGNFVKNTSLKYTLLAMKKFIKEFAFGSDDGQFMTSIKSKTKSKNYLDLRKVCHDAYVQALTPDVIQGLLNHLITNTMCAYCKSQNVSFDVQDSMIIDRNQQKQLSIQNCCILLIEAILEKFTDQAHNLVKNMIISSFKNNFEGVDPMVLNNIFGVLALLPKTTKKNIQSLNQIPIVQILGFMYQNIAYKNKIPTLIAGWFDYFSNDQLMQLINVLLQFIQNQTDTSLLLACCQSINKIILTKKFLLNMEIISKIFPVVIRTFEKTDSPQIMWPMVNLISNIIIICQFDCDIILNALQNNALQLLIANKSQILIQALSEMFKNILCVIPRNKQAHGMYSLISRFLNNHLTTLTSTNSEKVLNLWYILVREYSLIQNCNQQLIQLYKSHYKNNLFYKTPTLIYILEQYMLLGFVQTDISQYSMLIYEFYKQAEQMEKSQSQQLKIAALSFQITLITIYSLQQVNSNDMLNAILKDFYNLNTEQVSATVHNSLISIINRYIILYRNDFFNYLNSINVDLIQFYNVYLDNMQFLTSESAKKINSLAVVSLMPNLPNDFLIGKLHYILMIIIPSIENYKSTQHLNPQTSSPFTGKVMNSPTHRFASNFLSERKEQIRKKDRFENVNLAQIFKNQIHNVCSKLGTNIETIAQNFSQNGWEQRFYKLI